MNDKPLWTTEELAGQAGVTPRYIRDEINAGRLKAVKIGHSWAIFAEDAQQWLATWKRQRRPKTPRAK